MAKKKAKISAKSLEQKAKKQLALLKRKFMVAERKARNMVKKNPEKAVAIAAGVGAAIGTAVTAAIKIKKKKKK